MTAFLLAYLVIAIIVANGFALFSVMSNSSNELNDMIGVGALWPVAAAITVYYVGASLWSLLGVGYQIASPRVASAAATASAFVRSIPSRVADFAGRAFARAKRIVIAAVR